ncbi:MAG: hypothetical protein JXQ73_17845 [Phycisphaerae bacterium]|nr:hypothetical protein [Phycisphaerae bacterium]
MTSSPSDKTVAGSPTEGAVAASLGRDARRGAFLGDVHFLVCVIALGTCLVGVQALIWSGFQLSKERVDLKAPLTSLNEKALAPYRVVASDRIPKEEVEALGTEEYIRWRLEDTSISNRNDPLRWPTLFVTYYSGTPDQVPHVPEECFLGGGLQQEGGGENTTIKVPGLRPKDDDEVPVRILTFRKTSLIGGDWVPAVVYLFSVNGEFKATRTDVRVTLSNPFERYGYFSKVEVSFTRRQGGAGDIEVIRKAAEKLLRKVLPVLVHDHLPNWPPEEAPAKG